MRQHHSPANRWNLFNRVTSQLSTRLILNRFLAEFSLLALLILLAPWPTSGQQNPSIVHITPGQTVDLGDTVDLSCSVQYAANYPIIWTKLSDNPNNPPLFISKDAALTVHDNRYSIRHDDSSSTYTLQVSKVSFMSTRCCCLCWRSLSVV